MIKIDYCIDVRVLESFYAKLTLFQNCNGKYKKIVFDDMEGLKVEIENDTSGIVFANYQLASTGISIKNLHWLMFFVPIKSFIIGYP